MNDCLSYALFKGNHRDCFDFRTYLRGFDINLRMAQLLYPGYGVALTVDQHTYSGPYGPYFESLNKAALIDLTIVPEQPLCRLMLQRLNPLFTARYQRVLPRDTDSLLSYRERAAVQYWTLKNSVAHAITDSVSHTVALMGGMCGFKSTDIKLLFNVTDLDGLLALAPDINYSIKGSDQDFLNKIILPRVADSLTEHYIKGLPNSFRADYHNTITDLDMGLSPALRQTDALGWHIGASGFQVDATVKFLHTYGLMNDFWYGLERLWPEVFYWQF